VQLGLRGQGSEQMLQVARRLHWRQCSGPQLNRTLEQLMDWCERLRREPVEAPR
jgi:hypothetical protein